MSGNVTPVELQVQPSTEENPNSLISFRNHQRKPLSVPKDDQSDRAQGPEGADKPGNKHDLPEGVDMDKTILAIRRVGQSSSYDEPDTESKNGYYQGRPIIGRDTPINGGVYLGGGQREAIVVDESKSQYLNQIYQDLLMETAESRTDGIFKAGILIRVYEKVKNVMPADQVAAERVAAPFQNDQKVSLDLFIHAKAGVCRHQALLTAYFLERLKREGYVRGNVSVDRNAIRGVGGHAWVRYTNSAGDVYIIDPTQGFIGRLSDVRDDDQRWFYKRPTDK